jgi:hypothetical protein
MGSPLASPFLTTTLIAADCKAQAALLRAFDD